MRGEGRGGGLSPARFSPLSPTLSAHTLAGENQAHFVLFSRQVYGGEGAKLCNFKTNASGYERPRSDGDCRKTINMPHELYENPLVGRYSSREMQVLFGAQRRFSTWRQLWVWL